MSDNAHHTHGHDVVVNQSDEYYHNVQQTDNMMEEYSEKPSPPTRRPFYKKKKYWIICSILSAIIIIVVVLLALFVFFPMIAQSLMNGAKIDVNAAQITFSKPEVLNTQTYRKRDGDDMNSTFYMNMESALSNTGPFHATIKYHNPIEVLYKGDVLGNIFLFNDSSISGGKGQLNAITPFLIKDQQQFSAFAKDMMALESFTWTLRGKLDITALSRTATVNLNKDIVLNGMNGFPDVRIDSFQLPGDAPGGGILVELGTVLNSPSPIGVQLGTIALAIGYDGVPLGNVVAENIALQKGPNNLLLKGTLVPQNDTDSLAKVGYLFSNYVSGVMSNTSATGISAAPDGVNPISWLSEGFQSVKLNVALGSAEPLKIISAVQMGYLDLKFDAANPYNPIVTAPNVNANFQIPFGFTLNISEVTQNISLALNTSGAETTDFAVINVPNVPAVSDQQAGTLKFAINNDTIAGIPGRENVYNDYTYALTASDNYTFMISGNASTKTMTPIGPIELGGIRFTLPTSVHGLQFLNSTATIINSLDVTGGTSDNLNLAINVTMTNPSDVSISTGDVHFIMGASGTDLGLVTLSDLKLNRGDNIIGASATFNPKGSDVGQNLLSSFVMGKDNAVSISGFDNSSAIASLAGALSVVNLGTTLPGLKTALIQGGAMTVRPGTPQDGIVGVKVSLANPFVAGLSITKVVAAATFAGIPVGNIDQDISSNPFVIPGKATSQSQELDMTMNIEPAAVALLLRNLATHANLDTRSLDALLGLGGFHVDGMESIPPESSVFQGFNIVNYVNEAMKALKVDLTLNSGLTIGQYQNDLAFSQGSVSIATDDTVSGLIPIVGQPIVQQIVDGAILGFETIILSAPTDNAFTVQMKGSITKSGPMDAAISFPTPLTVAWQGKTLGTVSMPTINAKADVGANFDVTGTFSIVNSDDMATFAAFMINNENFVWDISTKDVSVNALGYTFNKISMEKFVTLDGAKGFKNAVTIENFDLPSNDPAGGITLLANTTIKNPSQVGFNLGGVAFEAIYKGIDLGPLASDGAAVFPPKGVATISMKGRLISQEGNSAGLAAVTEVFDNYLAANDSLVDVIGVSGSGPNGVVGWLTSAFKTVAIKDVILPGPKVKPELIPAITIKDMQLDFTKNAWAPPASSNNIQAQLKSPFGFPLGVSQLNMKAEATYQGGEIANLDVPDNKATTSSDNVITTQFSNVPFKAGDKSVFTNFIQLLTTSTNVDFGLKGTTNAIADTNVGALSLKNIAFDVGTSLTGFANFNGKAEILSIAVTGGTSAYTLIDLTFSLTNPSNITITVGDINFDVIMNEFNAFMGRVYVKDVVIPPGAKTFTAQMHLGEDSTNDKAIGQLFSDYLTSSVIPLTITGSKQSTNIAPLVPALSSVKLDSTMTGIAGNLIAFVAVKTSLTDLLQKKGTADITLRNPLKTTYAVDIIKASCVLNPSSGAKPFTVGSIDYVLPSPDVVPAEGSMVTEPWPVSIAANIIQLAELLVEPNKYFDIQLNVTVTVNGQYHTQMYYYIDHVPFSLTVLGFPTIGNSPESLSTMSLPANITSITDPAELEKALSDWLSGKKPSSSSAIPSSATIPPSASGSVSDSASATGSATDSPKPTTTEANTPTTTASAAGKTERPTDKITAASTTSEEKPKATDVPKFHLPF